MYIIFLINSDLLILFYFILFIDFIFLIPCLIVRLSNTDNIFSSWIKFLKKYIMSKNSMYFLKLQVLSCNFFYPSRETTKSFFDLKVIW